MIRRQVVGRCAEEPDADCGCRRTRVDAVNCECMRVLRLRIIELPHPALPGDGGTDNFQVVRSLVERRVLLLMIGGKSRTERRRQRRARRSRRSVPGTRCTSPREPVRAGVGIPVIIGRIPVVPDRIELQRHIVPDDKRDRFPPAPQRNRGRVESTRSCVREVGPGKPVPSVGGNRDAVVRGARDVPVAGPLSLRRFPWASCGATVSPDHNSGGAPCTSPRNANLRLQERLPASFLQGRRSSLYGSGRLRRASEFSSEDCTGRGRNEP